MMRLLLTLPLLLLTAASEETPFDASSEIFADAAACKARLAGLAADARGGGFDAVEGPYEITPATPESTRCAPKAPATELPSTAASPRK